MDTPSIKNTECGELQSRIDTEPEDIDIDYIAEEVAVKLDENPNEYLPSIMK